MIVEIQTRFLTEGVTSYLSTWSPTLKIVLKPGQYHSKLIDYPMFLNNCATICEIYAPEELIT